MLPVTEGGTYVAHKRILFETVEKGQLRGLTNLCSWLSCDCHGLLHNRIVSDICFGDRGSHFRKSRPILSTGDFNPILIAFGCSILQLAFLHEVEACRGRRNTIRAGDGYLWCALCRHLRLFWNWFVDGSCFLRWVEGRLCEVQESNI